MVDEPVDDGWDGLPWDTANRELVASFPLKLQCTVCGQIVALGDDPANRALWEADFIENDGWTRGPEGLICDRCSPPREPREPALPPLASADLPPESGDPYDDIVW